MVLVTTQKLQRAAIYCAIVIAAALPITAHAATLTELQNQLKKAQSELSKYQALQKQESNKVSTYSSQIQKTQQQIDQVKQSINALEKNISDKEQDITSTSQQIEAKSQQLAAMMDDLGNSIATYYEITNYSEIEAVASSGTITHYTDQTEYLYALQDRMVSDIDAVTKVREDLLATKSGLEQKKSELAALKGAQEQKNEQLQDTKEQKTALLNQSKLNEAQYRAAAKKLESQAEQISNEIYELRRRLSRQSNEVYLSATSGYPFSAINKADPWLFLTRQCTSYAAWKWNVVYGRPWYNTRPGEGSAYNWPNLARDQGYRVLSTPRVGAIVSWPRNGTSMPYGHVAIVEGVNGDGTINISEYNWVQYAFSRRDNVRYWDYGNASFIVP